MGCLDNKVAIVTGGAQGIGRGIALELAQAGANIVVADLNSERSQLVVNEIEGLGRDAIAIQLDVTSLSSIERGVTSALKYFSCIDILVNNAGVGFEEEGSPEEFDITYKVNLKGVWQVSQALISHFKIRQAGKIINVASNAGRQGFATVPAYCASKAAVINLTQSLACTLGVDNINVNAVCPGLVKTPMQEKYRDTVSGGSNYYDGFVQKHTQLKRVVTSADIGHAVVFLASTQAKNITGQALNVDGGHFMS